MVKRNGVYYVRTAQERELEKRVKERKRELMETYRAQRREPVASTHILNTETRRSVDRVDRGEEYSTILERRREERHETEESVGVRQRSNGLHSTPAPEQQSFSEPHDDRQFKRTPSFKLNAGKCMHFCTQFSTSQCHVKKNKCGHKTGLKFTVFSSVDGAILSQMSEGKSTPKVVTTCELQGLTVSSHVMSLQSALL